MDDAMVVANPFQRDDDLEIRESLSSEMDLSEKHDVEEPPVQTIELQTIEIIQCERERDTMSEIERDKMVNVVKAESDIESLEDAMSGDAMEKEYFE